jgi:hypothetical protein
MVMFLPRFVVTQEWLGARSPARRQDEPTARAAGTSYGRQGGQSRAHEQSRTARRQERANFIGCEELRMPSAFRAAVRARSR